MTVFSGAQFKFLSDKHILANKQKNRQYETSSSFLSFSIAQNRPLTPTPELSLYEHETTFGTIQTDSMSNEIM